MNRNYAVTLRRHRDWLLDPPVVGGNGEAEKAAQACEVGARAIEILDEIEDLLNDFFDPNKEENTEILQEIDGKIHRKRK